jgi:hypothetical protein
VESSPGWHWWLAGWRLKSGLRYCGRRELGCVCLGGCNRLRWGYGLKDESNIGVKGSHISCDGALGVGEVFKGGMHTVDGSVKIGCCLLSFRNF